MLAPYNTFGNNAVIEFDAPTYCNVINVCADQEGIDGDEEERVRENGEEEGRSGEESDGPNVHSMPPTLPTEAITTTVASSTTSTSTSTLTTTISTTTTTSATISTTSTTTTTQNPCQSTKKYHPTTKQLHTCTNNNNYPKLWTASIDLIAEYFFDSFEECCAAFYSPSSAGQGSEGECIVEDVCLDTPTGYPLYYLDLDFGICIQQSDDNGGFGEGMINLFNTLEECVSLLFVLFCVSTLYIIGMTLRTNSLSSNVIPLIDTQCNFDWIEDTSKCLSDSPPSTSSLTFHHNFTPSPTSPEPTSSPPTLQ